jgi:manganese transport protein
MIIKSRILSILFWSVIAAAFIGPGTVTTAASAGALFRYDLLWALLFSVVATLVLQEASSRITIISGRNLGEAIRKQYYDITRLRFIPYFVFTSIFIGCVAYETGNILGAVAGITLIFDIPSPLVTLGIGSVAAILMYIGSTGTVVRVLGAIVGIMGISFLTTAVVLKPSLGDLFAGGFVPSFPTGSGLLILGLIGTTVVPYNLFLGSGIARGRTLSEMRFGLTVAVLLGGIISMAVLVVGASITGTFSFEYLSGALSEQLGPWSGVLLGVGLCAAGLTSAITAPLAAAITARSMLGTSDDPRWNESSVGYRTVWGIVLLTGLIFGLTRIQPIPAIILAQALNGIVLPFAAVFLLIAVNDRALMGLTGLNNGIKNIVMCIVVFIAIVLGVTNIARAAANAMGLITLNETHLLITALAISVFLGLPVAKIIVRRRGISA